jgi:hypothetical protein
VSARGYTVAQRGREGRNIELFSNGTFLERPTIESWAFFLIVE